MFGNNTKKSSYTMADDKSTSILSKGTSVKGDLNTQGNLRLDGSIVGDCMVTQRLVSGLESSITGNIIAKEAEISGLIRGIIKIENILVLKSTSKITGDIFTNKLIVEEGAQFDGKCTMGEVVKKPEIERTLPTDKKLTESKI